MEFKFDKSNFEAEVLKSDKPVLVDFYADWCGPCQSMGPMIQELASQYDGRIKIGKVNVDENQELAIQYGVMTIPNFKFFKGGQVVDSTIGVTSKEEMEQRIENVL